ncbi:hypothetical protein HHL21_16990 [Massilia sp. RP-1-19]|uniref:Lipoprotein SmpA/OmlA domain-containing protein n=1 Tax=Massilia polaris TaxID=2728846 RepID=A0A848HN08_9BURK|nr:hypothetical protein [Massilia polaris]NML62745.1 hypothetical protein [Massilia polaris]
MTTQCVRLLPVLCAVLLGACASAPPPPGTVVAPARFSQAVIAGVTTRAELLAALGNTKAIVFDSGYEAWLYLSPAGADRYTEFVVLVGPDGVVRKTRRRDP